MSEIYDQLYDEARKKMYQIFSESPDFRRVKDFLNGIKNIRPFIDVDCDDLVENTITDVIDTKISILIAQGMSKGEILSLKEEIASELKKRECWTIKQKIKLISMLIGKIQGLEKEIDNLTKMHDDMLADLKREVENFFEE